MALNQSTVTGLAEHKSAAGPMHQAMMQTLSPTKLKYATDLGYHDRATKAHYIASKYAPVLGGSVLDVGCDEAPLRSLVGDPARYVGVDCGGSPDIRVDLDRDALPCADRAFDTVLCTDVLEHLERCHAVFDECCRVTADRLIVSLPNPLANLMHSLAGNGAGRMRHYGLPVDPPADRHRWFFGFDDAKRFLMESGARNGMLVEQLDAQVYRPFEWRNAGGENVLDHPNLRVGTVWCLFKRA